jgi:hypothetical protein
MTSTHLLDEYPLIVLPTLACAVGLNEAIVLQQINYWIANPKIGKMYDGLRWVRNSVEEWQQDNFPFWSLPTLKRIMANITDQNLIFKTATLNDNPYDKTLWYTLNKPTILLIVSEYQIDTIEKIKMIQSTSDQNDPIDRIITIQSLSDNTSDTTDNTLGENRPTSNNGNYSSNQRKDSNHPPKSSAPPPPKSRRKKKGADVPDPEPGVLNAICLLCYGTKAAFTTNASSIRGCYNKLAEVDPPITMDKLRKFYAWWYTVDWRGKKGQKPEPHQVIQAWPVAMAESVDGDKELFSGNAEKDRYDENAWK